MKNHKSHLYEFQSTNKRVYEENQQSDKLWYEVAEENICIHIKSKAHVNKIYVV